MNKRISTLKEHKEIHEPGAEETVVTSKDATTNGHGTGSAEGGTLILPASKWRPAHFNRPSSLCHVDGRNLQEGMMLVSQKHAVSLVCFDFFSEYQDSNSANRVSHFISNPEKRAEKGNSTTDLPSHGYLDSEDISSTRFWNPKRPLHQARHECHGCRCQWCVIRQLSRGHVTLAKAVQQVRTPRSNAQSLASSKNAEVNERLQGANDAPF